MAQQIPTDTAIRAGDPPLPKSPVLQQLTPQHMARRMVIGLCLLAAGAIVLLSLLVFFLLPYWHAATSVRSFEIEPALFSPTTMKPYGSFVIRSEKELRQAIADLQASIRPLVEDKQDENSWLQRCKAFEEQIRAAKPNFEKESIIILLASGNSSSTNVGLSIPHLEHGRLTYNIWARRPTQCVRDWVHRGFVVIVQNEMVAEVDVWEGGKHKEIVQVARRLRG